MLDGFGLELWPIFSFVLFSKLKNVEGRFGVEKTFSTGRIVCNEDGNDEYSNLDIGVMELVEVISIIFEAVLWVNNLGDVWIFSKLWLVDLIFSKVWLLISIGFNVVKCSGVSPLFKVLDGLNGFKVKEEVDEPRWN